MDGKSGKNSPRKLPPWLLVESSWVVVFPSTHPNTYFHHRQESAVIPHPLVSQELAFGLRSQVHALSAEDQAGCLRMSGNLRLEVFEDLFVQLGGGDGVASEFAR